LARLSHPDDITLRGVRRSRQKITRADENRELMAVLRYTDHRSYLLCRARHPRLAECTPKFILVIA
jgi:hypothetical protein